MNVIPVLTKDGLGIYDEDLKEYIQEQITNSKDTVLEYTSSFQFPVIGKPNTIYLDKAENKSFRWDNDDLKYYSLNDYENIQVINGCY